jgi:hypothetical protein
MAVALEPKRLRQGIANLVGGLHHGRIICEQGKALKESGRGDRRRPLEFRRLGCRASKATAVRLHAVLTGTWSFRDVDSSRLSRYENLYSLASGELPPNARLSG